MRARNGITILSIMITWALENAIETADSMKSRGYGLPGRTAFSIYRFDSRDRTALIWFLFCGIYIVIGANFGGIYWRYFPTMKGVVPGVFPISVFVCYFMLCATPCFYQHKGGQKMDCFTISGLTFSYPDQTVKALDGLNLSVRQGEFVTLMGAVRLW